MKVTIIGSGASVIRKERRSTSFVVETGEKLLLFDCGWGTPEGLLDAGIDIQQIDHIFISHPHTDHMGSLINLLMSILVSGYSDPGRARKKPLHLHGYPGFIKDYETLRGILFPSRTEEKYEITVTESGNGEEAFDKINYSSRIVPHSEHFQSIAQRIDCDGKSLVYTGDCGYNQALIDLAKDADLLITEMSFSPSSYQKMGKLVGHMWTGDCANIAYEANAKKLALVHLRDDWEGAEVVDEIRKTYNGEVIIAKDLQVIGV